MQAYTMTLSRLTWNYCDFVIFGISYEDHSTDYTYTMRRLTK